MILKLNNKDEEFYAYMGRIFGSRVIEKQINDRIYDDSNKEWYIYVEDEKVVAFASISNNVIKNVYSVKDIYLKEILEKIKKDIKITPSIVTNLYKDIYTDCKFKIDDGYNYKNFCVIY